jgi:hypothetical protein
MVPEYFSTASFGNYKKFPFSSRTSGTRKMTGLFIKKRNSRREKEKERKKKKKKHKQMDRQADKQKRDR